MEIFIHREDEDFGPFSLKEAQHRLDSGEFLPEDYAWFEGAPGWMALVEIPGMVAPLLEQKQQPSANTGLPAWIPPRRTDYSESTGTTSFASPAPRPLGIRTVSPKTDKPAQSTPLTSPARPRSSRPIAPKTPAQAREPASSAPIARSMAAISDDEQLGELTDPASGPTRNLRSIGLRNMILGALWFVGGAVVTFLAYKRNMAEGHAGIYLITGVAILAGLIQFLRGLVQYRKP